MLLCQRNRPGEKADESLDSPSSVDPEGGAAVSPLPEHPYLTIFRGGGNEVAMVCHLLGILSVVIGLTLYIVTYRLIK